MVQSTKSYSTVVLPVIGEDFPDLSGFDAISPNDCAVTMVSSIIEAIKCTSQHAIDRIDIVSANDEIIQALVRAF